MTTTTSTPTPDPTSTITTDPTVLTLVNIFTVEPEDQQELIDVLAEATTVMRQQPGFVSANLHRSTAAPTGDGSSTTPNGAAPRTTKPC